MSICQRPDRDAPRMTCGYPLPCPWHTVVIDTTAQPTTVTIPVTANLHDLVHRRVRQVAAALDGFTMPAKPRRRSVKRKVRR